MLVPRDSGATLEDPATSVNIRFVSQSLHRRHTCGPLVERRGNDQTTHGQRKKTSRRLCHHRVEVLLQTVEATAEETHSQNQEQIRQHTPNQRGLHNHNFILGQGDDGHDQFNSVSTH